MTSKLFGRSWARGLSLAAAASLALAVTVYPRGLIHEGVALDHGLLSLLMWGMSAGFVHGIGFDPSNRWLRVLLGPVIAWPTLLLGWALFVRNYLS
ncbi:MAG TPA: cyd operon YbgE family protein [Sulfuriferula sp.]|nr:cyd operon YbgE family protein [Sulfuriferula sp.]